jgi:hypothetical protein
MIRNFALDLYQMEDSSLKIFLLPSCQTNISEVHFMSCFVFKTIVSLKRFTYFMRVGCSLGLLWYPPYFKSISFIFSTLLPFKCKNDFVAFEINNFQNLSIYMFTSNAKQTKGFLCVYSNNKKHKNVGF